MRLNGWRRNAYFFMYFCLKHHEYVYLDHLNITVMGLNNFYLKNNYACKTQVKFLIQM